MTKQILKNTGLNYINLVISLIISLFLVRILFLNLSNEEYGFWVTLWSIFGYSLLLDFGFGVSLIKHTAQSNAKNSWKNYNEIISTYFFTYLIIGTSTLILITLFLYFNIEDIFQFSTKDIINYKITLLIFGLGMAISFPFGMFREILTALEEIYIRNLITILTLIVNFIFLISECLRQAIQSPWLVLGDWSL